MYFFTFFKLYKWYQITQNITYNLSKGSFNAENLEIKWTNVTTERLDFKNLHDKLLPRKYVMMVIKITMIIVKISANKFTETGENITSE